MNPGEPQKTQSKARRRGRPRKDVIDEPLKDKRARGREAQKNYMARKQAETRRLKDRIASLDNTVEAIVTEFIHFGDRQVNTSRALDRLLLLDDFKQTTARILDQARLAESLAIEQQDEGLAREAGPIMDKSTTSRETQSPSRPVRANFEPPFPSAESSLVSAYASSSPQTGHFSPHLGYGLLSKTSQIPAADEFSARYTVSGPNSFAFRLYKDTLILSIRILQGDISIPGFIPSLMRYRFRYENSDHYITEISDFLETLSLRSPAVDSLVEEGSGIEDESGIVLFGPSHPVMTSVLRASMYQDLIKEVGSVREWLDPYDTQTYLREHWGFKLTRATASFRTRPLHRPNVTHGELKANNPGSSYQTPYYSSPGASTVLAEESTQTLQAESLTESLIWKSVCFGDGPRFYKGNIDATAAEFIARMMLSHQEVGVVT